MTIIMLSLPVVVIPLLVWLLWDIGRKQAAREAARRAAMRRGTVLVTFTANTAAFTAAMSRAVKAADDMERAMAKLAQAIKGPGQ